MIQRDEDYVKLLNSTAWRNLRARVISAHPLCEECERNGFFHTATEVHHVVPVQRGKSYEEKAELCFDPNNLRALCHRCHVNVHRSMGKSAREAEKKRRKDEAEDFIRTFYEGGGMILKKGGGPV